MARMNDSFNDTSFSVLRVRLLLTKLNHFFFTLLFSSLECKGPNVNYGTDL